ncbi:Uncharacterised protein [uncultured archaeon]|nr:Uncharacterised protein [uncultured archaeon]
MEINAHSKRNARSLLNPTRIRAVPKRVTYENGIIIFDCIDDKGQSIKLKANSERAVVNLYTYQVGLSQGWVDKLKGNGSLDMVSSRKTNDPINWIICDGFIACFITDKFDFIEISKIKPLLKIPPTNWNFKIIEDEKGLFGGQFELSAEGIIIDVDCGINNGNDSPKIKINGISADFKSYHTKDSAQRIANYLNQRMNETPRKQALSSEDDKHLMIFNQARIELGSNEVHTIDDIILKMEQIAEAKSIKLSADWKTVVREKIKNEWATVKPR